MNCEEIHSYRDNRKSMTTNDARSANDNAANANQTVIRILFYPVVSTADSRRFVIPVCS